MECSQLKGNGLTVSSVAMECSWEKNIIHVKRANRNPSNTPIRVKMNTTGPGYNAAHPNMENETTWKSTLLWQLGIFIPLKSCEAHRKKNHRQVSSP